jgi:hypothetical protein
MGIAASRDLGLRCCCGRTRGVAQAVSPAAGIRFICYCKDCQAFARFLDRPDVLDAAGGTDIFQMPPAHVTFTAGFEALRCARLSSGVLRWYADCCRTPVANTAATPRFPVIALIHPIMDCGAAGGSRDALLGLPPCRIFERSATGPLPSNAPPPPSLGVFTTRAIKVVSWWTRGLARPNPFFDDRTKVSRSIPQLLSPRAD